MFSNGFGTPHPIRVDAQVPRAVLIKRFRRLPLRGQADDLGGAPVHPVRHQHQRATRQGLLRETHHDANLAQPGNADAQRKAPVCMHSYFDRTIGMGRDQRHERLDREVGTRQPQRLAVRISQMQGGRLQQAVLVEQADPVLPAPGQDLDQVLRQGPGVRHHDAKRPFAPDGLFHQVHGQRHVGAKRLVPCPKVGVLEPHRVDLFLEAMARGKRTGPLT